MKDDIINLIENESENTKLDFKLEQYPIEKGNIKKAEFLKDMCAFANLTSKDDKFIIIGAEERNGIAIGFKPIIELHDQATYQQFLNQYIEPEINFEYKEFIYQENRLAYFRIFNNDKRPYLFKEEYKDNLPKGNHYRMGTGFVRTGTSTRTLKRDDFEKIYSERFSNKDRSADITFDITIGRFLNSSFRDGHIKHLQVDVSNLSNASIDLDVEAKILNNTGVNARYTQDIELESIEKSRKNSLFSYTAHLDQMIPPHVYLDMNVEFKNYGDYSLYEITPQKGTHTALRVKQQGTVCDIFNGQIALVFSRAAEVEIELIVRSNEFPNGPKTFAYKISKEKLEQILDPWDL